MKNSKRNSKMGKRKSPEKLNQIAREKSFSKNLLNIWKIPINDVDHFKSGLGSIPCTWNFLIFKQWLWKLKSPQFELKFKRFEFQKCSKPRGDLLLVI